MSTPEEELQLLMRSQQAQENKSGEAAAIQELLAQDFDDEMPSLEPELTLDEKKAAALLKAQEKEVALDRSEARAENLNTPGKEFEHGAAVGIANNLGMPVDAVAALLSASGFPTNAPLGGGDNIMDVMESIGMIPEDMPLESQGAAGGAGEYMMGAAVITPVMLAPFLEAAAMTPEQYEMHVNSGRSKLSAMPEGMPRTRAAKAGFIIKQLGEMTARSAVKNPKTFIAAELGAAGVAGAVGKGIEESGGGPGARLAGEMTSGIAASFTLAGIPRAIRSMTRWGMSNLFPMTEAGGMTRAAAQTQERAEDITSALQRIDDAPEGVTAARATEDTRLMGQQQLIEEANPSLDLQVRTDLENASRRAQRDLRDLYDTPQGKADWEYALVNRVNPQATPGVDIPDIEPGSVESMIRQVYDNFAPIYDQIKGFPVRLHLMDKGRKTTLQTMLQNVPDTNTVVAGESARATVARFLNNQADEIFKRSTEMDGSPTVMSEQLLDLRSRIRTEARKANKAAAGGTNIDAADRASLFEVAEMRINQLLKEQLPEEAQTMLKSADEQYRNFKLLDNAVWSSRDQGLTPNGMIMAIRRSASSQGAYTRGEQMELRSMAHAGRPIDEYMTKPDLARRYVSEMGTADIANTQSQFMHSLLRRSISSRVTRDGAEVLDGAKLLGNLNKFAATGDAIGINAEDIGRIRTMAQQLRAMQNPPPGAMSQLFEDGPGNIVQLFGAMAAARSGTQAAKAVKGNPLVLAGFFTNKMRNFLAKVTSDKATEIMIAAAQPTAEGRALYKNLLTSPNALPRVQAEAARQLNAWLLQSMRPKDDEADVSYRETLRRVRREAEALGPTF